MRVLFTAFPKPSHYFPVVPLAWALRARGHSVRMAVSPLLADQVLHSGLPLVSCGDTVDTRAIWRGFDVLGAPGTDRVEHARARAARAMTMFTEVARAMSPDLIDFARRWSPDLIVHEPRAYAGLIAAEVLKVPLVRQLWGTDYTVDRWDAERPFLESLLGDHGLDSGAVDPLGTVTVDPCPPGLQLPAAGGERLQMRYVPYNGPGEVPAWLRVPADRPRVCVTWGTSTRSPGYGADPVERIVAALDGLDVELVLALSARHRESLSLPEGLRVVESMPLHLLLPSCAAVVHQGGAGTTLTAGAAGVPQLMFPAVIDGEVNSRGVVAAGAGLRLDTADLSDAGRIRTALETLLRRPSFREGARRLRAEFRLQPSPAEVAEQLEMYAG
ncbi:nucleotide disphospho-sugar-binding domain-containing protein [Streptomyces acidicola]|uniref:nucleotide disphospho-sugar-binding domain-containing protein n=1 Tax=Streptomyces acidicola TaxID=2596892 RepID=UPI00381E022C